MGPDPAKRASANKDLGSSSRASYAYTNFGLTEAAVAAAKVAGMPWEIVSEERLYRPAGMTRTSSRYSDFLATENRAVNSVRTGGKWVAGPPRDPDPQPSRRWCQLHGTRSSAVAEAPACQRQT